MTPAPGAGLRVAGRYDVVALLGAGGSAAVFRARDVRDGSTVALRLLHAHLADDEATTAECLRLAGWVHDHPHPHLAAVLGSGRTRSITWTALELVDGQDASTYAEAESPVPVAVAASAVAGILSALAHLHAHGVVHGDVSLGNVLLEPGGRAVLLDVGGTVRGDGRVLASPVSAAPEIATGGPPSASSDVYGAGVVLATLLTGAPPFTGEDIPAVLRAHVRAPVPRPSATRPDVPPGVDDLVVALLSKDPAARPGPAQARDALLVHTATPPAPAPAAPPPPLPAVRRGLPSTGTQPVPFVPPTTPTTPTPAASVASTSPSVPSVPSGPTRTGPAPLGADRPHSRAAVGTLLTLAVVLGLGTAAALTTRPPESSASGPESSPSWTGTATPAPVDAAPPAPAAVEPPPPAVTTAPIARATATVPAVAGTDVATARDRVEVAGLAVAGTRQQDGAVAAGTVLGSDPPEGDVLDLAAPVTLVVASGWTTVPDVAGTTTTEASRLLTAAGVAPVTAPGATAGASVERTYPAAGRRVAVGQDVLLASAPTATSGPEPTPAPTASP